MTRGGAIDAVVWGAPLPGSSADGRRVESIGAVGAGLLIDLADAGGAKTLLKVAQPKSWRVEDGRVVVEEAASVPWAGKRLARAEGFPAVDIRAVTGGAA